MTIQPNGTDAKDIALHFVNITVGKATPAIMKKTISQAKTLLSSGYTKEEIIKAIDYIIDVMHVDMYSLGYVNTAINDVLKQIRQKEKEEAIKEIVRKAEEEISASEDEVVVDEESSRRNREKIKGTGIQSRFGEKFNFDMFER